MRRHSARAPRTLLALVAALAVAVGGCSAGSSSTPTPSPSLTLAKTPTPAEAGPPATFFTDLDREPIATTRAREDSSYSGATFSIVSLETDARSTVLVWSATHPRTLEAGRDFDVTKWQSFPVITTPTTLVRPLTYTPPGGTRRCVCTDLRAMRADPNPQGALYPPLPKSIVSVTLTSPWFEPVTVPVTHR